MKLAHLLSQFLYTYKKLDLPGFGSFVFDPNSYIDPDAKGKEMPVGSIQFESNPSITQSPELIDFISSQSGKIKALAAADLDSHLNLIQQFLNIGKPFTLEGIGNLVKVKSGEYAFVSGEAGPEKVKEYSTREITATSSTEDSFSDYKSVFYGNHEKKFNWRKPAVVLLIIGGVGLAIWGGYTVYKMTTGKNKAIANKKNEEAPVLVSDSAVQKKDSVAPVQNTTNNQINNPVATGTYKFILETSDAKRAFDRFAKLKAFQWAVQMETQDSITYKLFMVLPASPADTSRLLDSLSMLNGRRVYISQ